MKSIEYDCVRLEDGFWKNKQKLNEDVSIYSVWNRFYDTGRIGAFKCDWKQGMDNQPHYYWDSDVAKWIEAVAYIIKSEPNSVLEERVDGIIDLIEKNQWDDGYFNIYFTVSGEERFTNRNSHELYCAGHLMEAAVAYYQTTGKDKFLNCMKKYADLIYKVFKEEDGAVFTTPGHECIEMALIKLYKCTNEKRYLELAGFFLDKRGANKKDYCCVPQSTEYYCQDYVSVRDMDSAEGHAVRALYLYCGMADYAKETNDDNMLEACRKLISDIINQKMYITGGVGSTFMGEAFTIPYDLPNESAYSETCASIALMMFAQRMLEIDNDVKYADIVERSMFNGMLDGISLDGKKFFYENPLEVNLETYKRNRSTTTEEHLPITQRVEVFECSCCPPNINRIMASIQRFAYAVKDGAYYINQFMDSTMTDGENIIRVKTKYPCDGKINITAKNIDELNIRIPSWCDKVLTNEQYEMKNGYMNIKNPSANFTVEFEMKPVLVTANTNVRADCGKAALQYGPIVYCIEGIDNGDVYSIRLADNLETQIDYDETYGTNVITAKGYRKSKNKDLYYKLSDDEYEQISVKLIPYSCHANRGESDMIVWFNLK